MGTKEASLFASHSSTHIMVVVRVRVITVTGAVGKGAIVAVWVARRK